MDDVKSKGVHVKLDRETHYRFRTRLLQHDVTMQDAFEEFARLVGIENPAAVRMIERMVNERIKRDLDNVGIKSTKRKPRRLSELDNERLYDIINEGHDESERGRLVHGDHNEISR